MKTRLIFALSIIFCSATGWGNEDEASVRQCFESYKSSILKTDGPAASSVVTTGTLSQYGNYLEWCKHSTKGELEELSFLNRTQVILIKHRVPKDIILSTDGKGIFEYAVNNDWIGKTSVIQMSIDNIHVSSGRAVADVVVGGKKTPAKFQFKKEQGAWKFDLQNVMKNANAAFKQIAQEKGIEENELIFLMAESISGRKVQESVWLPLVDPEHNKSLKDAADGGAN